MMRILSVLLCLILLFSPVCAYGEECFVIDVDSIDMTRVQENDYVQSVLAAPAQAISVCKYISQSDEQAAPVRLTLTRAEDGMVVFDKNYGYVGGEFDSGVLYLPYVDSRTIPYIVTLTIGDWVYALPFFCQQLRLTRNGACTYGVRMRDYDASLTSDWMMGTMLDLDALRASGGQSVSVCASNAYVVGDAQLQVADDCLWVNLSLYDSAAATLQYASVYCVTDVSQLTTAEPNAITLPAYGLNQPIPLNGATSCLLYVPMILDYDPSGLSGFSYDLGSSELQYQLTLWQSNQNAMPDLSTDQPYTEQDNAWYDDWSDEATAEPTEESWSDEPTDEPQGDPNETVG